ncbi:cytochrome P450 [Xylariaceae sp. FL1019]|nr:cytochrome P450 [Xylariaceae sp. FL1019]
MDNFHSLLSGQNIVAAVVLSYVTLALILRPWYRLYPHPIARFPGLKSAAVTRLYEGYYDFHQNGQYTFKDSRGPIIRISPHELHAQIIWTAEHSLHKNRRLSLNPFFSKAKVSAQQDMSKRDAEALFGRLSGFAESQKDCRYVTNEYVYGKHYDDVAKEDFDAGMLVAAQAGGLLWRTTKYIRFLVPLMRSIPPQWIMPTSMNDTNDLMKAAASPKDDNPHTIVHEIMRSKLTASDKSSKRVFDEVASTTGTGFETTTAAVIQKALRAEPAAAPDCNSETLEQLPYLTATIMEAMRLSSAIDTRSARIAQKRSHLC